MAFTAIMHVSYIFKLLHIIRYLSHIKLFNVEGRKRGMTLRSLNCSEEEKIVKRACALTKMRKKNERTAADPINEK